MTTCVISLRLPSAVNAALQRSATRADMSVPDCLNWLLRHSFESGQLVGQLADCPEILDAKLDVRIPLGTSEQLKSLAGRLGLPASVYIRKLLYHFYITKSLKYERANGHYALSRTP
jgi:hypothetical protein